MWILGKTPYYFLDMSKTFTNIYKQSRKRYNLSIETTGV